MFQKLLNFLKISKNFPKMSTISKKRLLAISMSRFVDHGNSSLYIYVVTHR
jgi:hypothetical protein